MSTTFRVHNCPGIKHTDVLEPCSAWEVCLTAVNQNGESEHSHSRWVSTLSGQADLLLPPGTLPHPWRPCWISKNTTTDGVGGSTAGDQNRVSKQFCYYYNEATKLSQWDHPFGRTIPQDRANRPLGRKIAIMLDTLSRRHHLGDTNKIIINVSRDRILQDSTKSFERFLSQEDNEGRLKLYRPTNIRFKGEDGIDSGGLSRDWYISVSTACLAPDLALFRCNDASGLYGIMHHQQSVTKSSLSYFRFLGLLMAKALYNRQLVEVPFCKYIFRHILGEAKEFQDLQEVPFFNFPDPMSCLQMQYIFEPFLSPPRAHYPRYF